MTKDPQNLTDRQIHYDYLRVFAAFAVVMLHVAAQNWFRIDMNSFEWKTLNFFDSIVRWCVPVFTMISGALFLNRDIPLKKIYSKYVLRLIVSFVVWSTVYAWFYARDTADRISKTAILLGQYHMWFIVMLIGLYLCIPFIKSIVEDDNRTKYYLILSFIFVFAFLQIQFLTQDFAGERVIRVVSIISNHVGEMGLNVLFGYTSYFVLGYYLNKIRLNRNQRRVIYLLGLLGFITTIWLTSIVTLKQQAFCTNYHDNFSVNVLLESIAVFTWFQYRDYTHVKGKAFVVKLSKYSFGAYLVHVLVLDRLNIDCGLNTLSFHPALSVPCISFIVFLISFAISAILNQIPIVKKYMV